MEDCFRKNLDSLIKEASSSDYKPRKEVVIKWLKRISDIPIGHVLYTIADLGYGYCLERYMKEQFDDNPGMEWKENSRKVLEILKNGDDENCGNS